jgi:hypothetical protein
LKFKHTRKQLYQLQLEIAQYQDTNLTDLVMNLKKEGAEIFITDINEEQLKHVASHFDATVISPDKI